MTVKTHRANKWTLGLAAVLLLLSAGCREQTSEQPPIHLNPNMDDQAYLEAQEPNAIEVDGRLVVANRRGMRSYVAHTVPTDVSWALRDSPRFYQGYALTMAPNAEGETTQQKRYETDIPPELGLSPETLAERYASGTPLTWANAGVDHDAVLSGLVDRGEERFGIFCTPCHGITGNGRGSVAVRSGEINPANYHTETFRAYPVGKIYDVITNGAGTMQGMKAQIPVRDRWAIAVYVKALQLTRNVAYSELPPEQQQKNWGSK